MTGYVLEKCEDAWTTYLSSSISSSINIYRGIDWVDKEGPAVICFAESADEDFPYSGVYHVRMTIHFRYPFEDSSSLASRNVITEELDRKVLGNPDLVNSLTGSTTNLGIYAITFAGGSNGFAGDSWISTTGVDMVAVSTV